MPRHKNEYYKSDEEFLFALADALREEYAAVIDAGLYLQVDDAFLPYMYDVAFADQPMRELPQMGGSCASTRSTTRCADCRRTRSAITSAGAALTRRTRPMSPLRDIVDLVLQVNAGAYCLEMANPRHEHEWRVWEPQAAGRDASSFPGVVGHATNIVEHPELVAERLVRLAKLVGRDNVIGGTDCGFAQAPFTNRVHPSIVWAKLAALAEGARIATKELWGK